MAKDRMFGIGDEVEFSDNRYRVYGNGVVRSICGSKNRPYYYVTIDNLYPNTDKEPIKEKDVFPFFENEVKPYKSLLEYDPSQQMDLETDV